MSPRFARLQNQLPTVLLDKKPYCAVSFSQSLILSFTSAHALNQVERTHTHTARDTSLLLVVMIINWSAKCSVAAHTHTLPPSWLCLQSSGGESVQSIADWLREQERLRDRKVCVSGTLCTGLCTGHGGFAWSLWRPASGHSYLFIPFLPLSPVHNLSSSSSLSLSY